MSEEKFVGFGISLRPEVAYKLRLLAAVENKNRSALIRELIETGLRERGQSAILSKMTREGQG